jgi:hypothetical protein
MDLPKIPLEEVQSLLRLLAEFEREELALLMHERMEAEREGRLIDNQTPAMCRGICWLK